MKAVILAGGKGTRLAPYTTVFPKPMMPIADRPILDVVLKQLKYYGFTDIIISVGYLAELLKAYFQNGNAPKGMKLTFIEEEHPLGTAGSLSLVPNLNETFLMMNGDVLTTLDYGKFANFHRENGAMVTICMHKRHVKIDFGVMNVNEKTELIGYDEKPTLHYLVSMGVYVFEPKVLGYIKPNEKLDFPDLVKILLKQGKKVQGYPCEDYWLDIGRHDDYAKATKDFEAMKDQFIKE